MKSKLVGCLVGLLMASPAVADQSLGVNVGTQSGHSYSSDYAVFDGYTTILHYENYKTVQKIRWSYGVALIGYSWTRRDNRDGHRSKEYTGVAAATGTMYLQYFEKTQPFCRVGAGGEIGDSFQPAVLLGYGVERILSKRFSVELSGWHPITEDTRHDLFTLGVKFRF